MLPEAAMLDWRKNTQSFGGIKKTPFLT